MRVASIAVLLTGLAAPASGMRETAVADDGTALTTFEEQHEPSSMASLLDYAAQTYSHEFAKCKVTWNAPRQHLVGSCFAVFCGNEFWLLYKEDAMYTEEKRGVAGVTVHGSLETRINFRNEKVGSEYERSMEAQLTVTAPTDLFGSDGGHGTIGFESDTDLKKLYNFLKSSKTFRAFDNTIMGKKYESSSKLAWFTPQPTQCPVLEDDTRGANSLQSELLRIVKKESFVYSREFTDCKATWATGSKSLDGPCVASLCGNEFWLQYKSGARFMGRLQERVQFRNEGEIHTVEASLTATIFGEQAEGSMALNSDGDLTELFDFLDASKAYKKFDNTIMGTVYQSTAQRAWFAPSSKSCAVFN